MSNKSKILPAHLIGKQWGRLTVKSYHETKAGKRRWRCECECGSTCLITTSAINRGKIKSCGCLAKEKQYQDLIGLKFGKLTVLHKDLNFTSAKSTNWMCQCECGNHKSVTTSELNADRAASCGCHRRRSKTRYKDIHMSYWNRFIYNAIQRGFEFDITVQQAWDIFEKQSHKCALSGIPISFGYKFTKDETTASLDRIDSSKGYLLDNVQWVHKRINIMKMRDSNQEFINWCTAVANFNQPSS